MKTFAERAIEFYANLSIGAEMPAGVEVLNPYPDTEVQSVVSRFFGKFYDSGQERIILLGINPGRFGAGITGITFTDPLRLEKDCGISNSFDKRSELSSRFVYDVIHAYGGTKYFFSKYFLSAVSPLGFVRAGRNLNYYDDRELENGLRDFIIETLRKQVDLGIRRDRAVCLGEGKNYKYLMKLNREIGLFSEILPLSHPRWVMQYRFRKKEEYIRLYMETLNSL
jgi:hypothetical protein